MRRINVVSCTVCGILRSAVVFLLSPCIVDWDRLGTMLYYDVRRWCNTLISQFFHEYGENPLSYAVRM